MKAHLIAVAVVSLGLFGCHRSAQNTDAVRQGVLDYLASKGMNTQSMQVDVTSISFREKEADATVSFRAKGSSEPGFQMVYTLERKGDRWAVKGRKATGSNPHGSATGGGIGGGMGSMGGAMGSGTGNMGGMGGGASQMPPGHPPVGQQAPSGPPK